MRKPIPHYSDVQTTPSMRHLIAQHGSIGYHVFFTILERLRVEGTLNVSEYNIISRDLHVKNSIVKSVVEDFGLFAFTDDCKRFYSEEVNELIDKENRDRENKSKAGRASAEARRRLSNSSTGVEQVLNNSSISKDINNISSTKEDNIKPTKVGSKTDNKLSALGNAHTRARKFFESFYADKCGQHYYFTAKDAGQLRNLLRAITHNLKEAGKPTDDDSVLDKFKNYIRYAYDNNKWIREHFSITNLSSQYNEIRSSLTGKDNGRKPIRPEQLHVENDPSKFDEGFK